MRLKNNTLSIFTIDEIREEVSRRGYTLMPKRKSVSPVACICSCEAICWKTNGKYQVECPACKRCGDPFPQRRAAILAWNEMISKGCDSQ